MLDELVEALQAVLYKIFASDCLSDLRDEVLSVLRVLHDGSDRRDTVSECNEGSLGDFAVGIFDSNQNSSEDGLLEGLVELEVELLELFADESDGQNGDFLDDEVLVAHVGGDFLGNAFPLLSRYFDAADRCDDLCEEDDTLAAALRMSLSLSIMVLMTMSLNDDLPAGLSRSHRKASSEGWVRRGVHFF